MKAAKWAWVGGLFLLALAFMFAEFLGFYGRGQDTEAGARLALDAGLEMSRCLTGKPPRTLDDIRWVRNRKLESATADCVARCELAESACQDGFQALSTLARGEPAPCRWKPNDAGGSPRWLITCDMKAYESAMERRAKAGQFETGATPTDPHTP